MTHRVHFVMDRGNLISRIIQNIKCDFCTVGITIHDNHTKAEWNYDKYNMDFEDGDYVLTYFGMDGIYKKFQHTDLRIKEDDPEDIFILVKNSKFINVIITKRVTYEELQEYSDNRLGAPLGFDGFFQPIE